ncbi:MAG: TonB-dependent receptor [Candidatus Thiodiazotropha sp.]
MPEISDIQPTSTDLEGEDTDIQRLIAIIDKHTKIATKTRLNADFVPGMVTVLRGEDLEASGKRIVWEALIEVPGIELFEGKVGSRNLIVRGVGKSFASGNIKMLVNGIEQNSYREGKAWPVLDLPIAQVERIEVIRGPGSAVHGGFAYIGVINVITRSQGNRLFARTGSHDSYHVGGVFDWSDGDAFDFSLNLSGEQSADGEVTSGPDLLGSSPPSNAPGPVNDARDARAAILGLKYHGFSFDLQYLHNGHGEKFGITNILPPSEDRVVFEHTNITAEARQHIGLAPSLSATLRLGWLRQAFKADSFLLAVTPLNNVLTDVDYQEQHLYGGLAIEGRLGAGHELLLDLLHKREDAKKAGQISNDPIMGPEGDFVLTDKNRTQISLSLQDQIHLNKNITVTAGVRYDDYSDVGNQLSPRLAAVWRATDQHIFKIQYAEAFRPPTLVELYTTNNPIAQGNPDIKPTTSESIELAYIYKHPNTTARATLFHTDLNDLIVLEPGQYVNSGGARLQGMELEFEHELSSKLFTTGTVSYTDAEDQATGTALEGASNWLFNLGMRYRFRPNLLFDARYRYVSERAREPTDSRNPLNGYQTIDITANLANLLGKGTILRGGIRNLFDEDVRYPAAANTYPDDYPQRGRQWWLQAFYQF